MILIETKTPIIELKDKKFLQTPLEIMGKRSRSRPQGNVKTQLSEYMYSITCELSRVPVLQKMIHVNIYLWIVAVNLSMDIIDHQGFEKKMYSIVQGNWQTKNSAQDKEEVLTFTLNLIKAVETVTAKIWFKGMRKMPT